MKLLKICIDGLPLFRETLEIDFYANQRVSQDKNEMLSKIFSNSTVNLYTNNILSFIGINASGKTSTLRVLSFVIEMLKNTPIGAIEANEILEGLAENKTVCIKTYFAHGDYMYKLETYIVKNANVTDKSKQYSITDETLWAKKIKSIRSKESLCHFTDQDIIETREKNKYLLDDVSIIVGINKEHKIHIEMLDSIEWTNFNGLRMFGDFPLELIKFLDPTIEYLRCNAEPLENRFEIKLKLPHKEELTLNSPLELSTYLSSGTIKGINVFIAAMLILQKGGYLIIDELENHFNIEIVSSLLRFFTDKTINATGATIIFSTHYTELIDNLERNDCIYVCRNNGSLKAENLHTILGRNDVKKSEWFQSGYLEMTTPSYESYIDFKRVLVNAVKKEV